MTPDAKVLLLVERELDRLVNRAEEAIRQTDAAKRKDLEESQLRNLLNLAAATDSIPAIKNFVAYQIGRKALPDQFGKRVLSDLDAIQKEAQELCNENGIQERDRIARARAEMVRYYFGFLNRQFVADRKGGTKS